jgi:DmsE family decaheme c-type cytochrome
MKGIDVGAHSVRTALCTNTVKRKLAFLALAPFLFAAGMVFCPAAADQRPWHGGIYSDSAYSALAEHLEFNSVAAKELTLSDDVHSDPYSALLNYVQQIDSGQPKSLSAQLKLAEAKNAYEALREFLNGRSEPTKPPLSEAPKATKAVPPPRRDVVDATIVGEKACLTCHVAQAHTFHETLMGRIDLAKITNRPVPQCETCHGPGSAHVKAKGGRGVGGIISFRPNDPSRTVEENNAICLGCHEKGQQTYWKGSTHEMREVACTNCHTIMKRVSRKFQLKTAFEPDTCFQCHKDKRAQMFRSSHMPLREGKIVCTGCHNPHGSPTEGLLKEASINDTCYKCHAEKRGPFLFEHAPVRENCLSCHNPHGSVNEYLLKISRPRICAQCHGTGHQNFLSGGPVQIGAIGRACQNCHTQIHGTNSPGGALLHR